MSKANPVHKVQGSNAVTNVAHATSSATHSAAGSVTSSATDSAVNASTKSKTAKKTFDIKELLTEAMDINKAQKTTVAVNIYIDESAASTFKVFVRSRFNSEAPNSRVMVSYFPTQTPDVEAPCDIAIIAAHDSVESVALAAALRSLEVPFLVITQFGARLVKRAQDMGHPFAKGEVITTVTEDTLTAENKEDITRAVARWILKTMPEKRLAFSLAYPFMRKPLANDAVFATAAQNAGVGAVVFIPGADMPIMTLNQAKMILQIAAAYGQPLNLDRVKELAATLGNAFLCRSIARSLAGLVPVLGWAIKGTVGYVGTVALGKAAIEYFEGGGNVSGLTSLLGKVQKTLIDGVTEIVKQPSPQAALQVVSDKVKELAADSLDQVVPVMESATDIASRALKPTLGARKNQKTSINAQAVKTDA